MKIKDIISGTKKRVSRDSRKRRIKQGDTISGVDHLSNISESVIMEGGRIDHVEDLVLFQGSEGIKNSIKTLRSLEHSPQQTTIKWDGKPAVIFGRNEQGEFVLTDKSGFGAKTYRGRVTSPKELQDMLIARAPDDEGRRQYAEKMASLWPAFEGSVGKDFRGYVHGDLLWQNTPQEEKGKIVFEPNTTKYFVNPRSAIGRKIAQSKVGVVVHMMIDLDGNVGPVDSTKFVDGPLMVMPPQTLTQAPEVDVPALDELEAFGNKIAGKVDQMLNVPAELKLTDLNKIFYTYINASTKSGNLDNMSLDGFLSWLQTSKVSVPKQQRIAEYMQTHGKTFSDMFDFIGGIQRVKNAIIQQLDNQPADITATTDGQPGGEGYVVGRDVKLVNRSGFSAANARKNMN